MNTPQPIDERQFIKLLQKHTKQLANMLRPHFAPWSLFQPPSTNVNATGNRAVALTANAPVVDTIDIPMTAGVAKWTFARQFSSPPIVHAIALKAYPGGAPQEIFIKVAPTTQGVVFQSSANDDVRVLHMTATLTPS